ncbi:histidine kinase [Pseudoflavitalea sp. G-6-1-2]|uniref:histidine kinase n=1 Tax=Pseudoflavitalea sp. G-6-1-2 TaxID=2728841 RepID=UPI00146D3830|nr:histidine kinase [Pseudoflavitalea sp. G-6-1-2]NML24107.1 histidine kinase [Pseudoflavitalea sp. G-6-1-2]
MNRILLAISMLCILAACKYTPDKAPGNQNSLLNSLEKEADSLGKSSPDIQLQHWEKRLHQSAVQKDRSANAFVHYQLAKYLIKQEPDSAAYHINLALEFSEEAPASLKFAVCNGAGIVAESQGKYYQAAYYFNESAAIVISSDSAAQKPMPKVICLLNAAQYNNKFGQHAKAIRQNKLALQLLQQMPEPSARHVFRAYSQLFTASAEEGNISADSLKANLHHLQLLAMESGDPQQQRFFCDHAGHFYLLKQQTDSAIHYYEKVKAFDQQALEAGSSSALRNLFITQSNLALLYSKSARLKSAETTLQSIRTLESAGAAQLLPDEKALALKALLAYNFASGNLHGARVAEDSLAVLNRTISRSAAVQATSEMEAIYQLQAKDRNIRSMQSAMAATDQQLKLNRLLLYTGASLALLVISWLVMLAVLHRQRRKRQEKDKALLQQQLLRTQMEPHFIFNTLSVLQSFIRFGEKDKAILYLNQFSKLLRSNLELSRQNFVPLSEELDALSNYLSLQQMRYEQGFQYVIDDGELKEQELLVPPMLIQPYVENAILHGIGASASQGNIVVKLELKNPGLLQVAIIDNGKGFPSAMPKEHRSLSGIIARERLAILAREEKNAAAVEISSGPQGTTVLLTLPVHRQF